MIEKELGVILKQNVDGTPVIHCSIHMFPTPIVLFIIYAFTYTAINSYTYVCNSGIQEHFSNKCYMIAHKSLH